ncbi:hypothetical protein WG909_05910 [Peptostreptococcaceae bacterium AGR-M142]
MILSSCSYKKNTNSKLSNSKSHNQYDNIKSLYAKDFNFIDENSKIENIDLYYDLEELSIESRSKDNNIEFLKNSTTINNLKTLNLNQYYDGYLDSKYFEADESNSDCCCFGSYIVFEGLDSICNYNSYIDLSFLKNASTLEHLNINNLNLCKNINDIRYLSNLKTLDLKCFYDENELKKHNLTPFDFKLNNLKFLNSLDNLDTLTLRKILTIKDFSSLNNKNISTLNISQLDNLSSFDGISNLTNLKNLNIHGAGSKLQADKFKDINNLDRLENLSISNLFTAKDICKLNLKNLTDLEIGDLYEINNLDCLNNLPNLKNLTIHDLDSLENTNGITNLKNLQTLSIYSLIYSDKLFDSLLYMDNLQSVEIFDIYELKDINFLKNSNIKNLRLSSLDELCDISALKTLNNLENLTINHCSNINKDELDEILKNNKNIDFNPQYD